MEEVVFHYLQGLLGDVGVLVELPDGRLDWNQDGWSDERRASQTEKLISKKRRSDEQVEEGGFDYPIVRHY